MPVPGYNNNAQYESQAADVQYRYNTDKAANAYGRFLSQQRGSRSTGDLRQTYNRTLPSYKSQFGQRGLMGPGVNSGVQKRAMGNFLGDYTRDYSRAQSDATQEAQNYDLQSANLDAYLNNSLAALEIEKQRDIANSAQALEALRGILGGAF